MRRVAAFLTVVTVMLLAGCGYPGDPLPPALRRPVRVADLSAVQRAGKIVTRFTMPTETTEGLQVEGSPEVEIRVGPAPEGTFNTDVWEQNAQRIPATQIHIANGQAQAEIDSAKFVNQTAIVGARVLGPKGRNSGWSNLVPLHVVAALPQPAALEAKDQPDSVYLAWHAAAPRFRVFRRVAGKGDFTLAGTSNQPNFVDKDIEYGTAYEYEVQAIESGADTPAESEISAPVTFKPTDRFPPAVPTGLSAVPGTRSVELAWDGNTEKDLASYRVYRDGQAVGGVITAPTFSDREATPGVAHQYTVSAVDTAGNESARSAAVTATIQ